MKNITKFSGIIYHKRGTDECYVKSVNDDGTVDVRVVGSGAVLKGVPVVSNTKVSLGEKVPIVFTDGNKNLPQVIGNRFYSFPYGGGGEVNPTWFTFLHNPLRWRNSLRNKCSNLLGQPQVAGSIETDYSIDLLLRQYGSFIYGVCQLDFKKIYVFKLNLENMSGITYSTWYLNIYDIDAHYLDSNGEFGYLIFNHPNNTIVKYRTADLSFIWLSTEPPSNASSSWVDFFIYNDIGYIVGNQYRSSGDTEINNWIWKINLNTAEVSQPIQCPYDLPPNFSYPLFTYIGWSPSSIVKCLQSGNIFIPVSDLIMAEYIPGSEQLIAMDLSNNGSLLWKKNALVGSSPETIVESGGFVPFCIQNQQLIVGFVKYLFESFNYGGLSPLGMGNYDGPFDCNMEILDPLFYPTYGDNLVKNPRFETEPVEWTFGSGWVWEEVGGQHWMTHQSGISQLKQQISVYNEKTYKFQINIWWRDSSNAAVKFGLQDQFTEYCYPMGDVPGAYSFEFEYFLKNIDPSPSNIWLYIEPTSTNKISVGFVGAFERGGALGDEIVENYSFEWFPSEWEYDDSWEWAGGQMRWVVEYANFKYGLQQTVPFELYNTYKLELSYYWNLESEYENAYLQFYVLLGNGPIYTETFYNHSSGTRTEHKYIARPIPPDPYFPELPPNRINIVVQYNHIHIGSDITDFYLYYISLKKVEDVVWKTKTREEVESELSAAYSGNQLEYLSYNYLRKWYYSLQSLNINTGDIITEKTFEQFFPEEDSYGPYYTGAEYRVRYVNVPAGSDPPNINFEDLFGLADDEIFASGTEFTEVTYVMDNITYSYFYYSFEQPSYSEYYDLTYIYRVWVFVDGFYLKRQPPNIRLLPYNYCADSSSLYIFQEEYIGDNWVTKLKCYRTSDWTEVWSKDVGNSDNISIIATGISGNFYLVTKDWGTYQDKIERLSLSNGETLSFQDDIPSFPFYTNESMITTNKVIYYRDSDTINGQEIRYFD